MPATKNAWFLKRQVEFLRLDRAEQELAAVTQKYDDLIGSFGTSLNANTHLNVIKEFGSLLWQQATLDAKSGYHDDRSLYWGRLKAIRLLKKNGCEQHCAAFDRCARGLERLEDDHQAEVLVTGFDPFGLERSLSQCNPSGLIALLLDNLQIEGLRVRTAIFPVRYIDFDEEAIVERFLTESCRRRVPQLIVTCSMGRNQFDLERFVIGRRTSTAADNCNVVRADERIHIPQIQPFDPDQTSAEWVEFVESSLPFEALNLQQPHGTLQTRVNADIETRECGKFTAQSLESLKDQTARQGSGGGFLSNEISYRSIMWVRPRYFDLPVGHVHVPRISGYDREELDKIVTQFQHIFSAWIKAIESNR